jgi:hypothetical protein
VRNEAREWLQFALFALGMAATGVLVFVIIQVA